ncbi:cupin domain-containing protein [Nitrospirillum viridazoti Y2]|uniref:Cupin domain n=1 Tax=Nitrospirillum amazonense TaxID=28077 RepID=A0A560HNH0_9PROT|nr:cupin domain-containing protein [Nitrospirillum amazonense]EGY00618.1 cupin domain-containing protein [Nitrospirillum amazonense Y2]TWB47059.1 cupin domain [Nitrospirillum amazonense]
MIATADALTAHPIDALAQAWVPLRPGLSFRPLHFAEDGYDLQLRVEPGTVIPRHRHSGEVHAYTLSGSREIIETGEIIGPGVFVHEPAGNVDSWRTVGDEPCVIHISLTGDIDYLDDRGQVIGTTNSASARAAYLAWCAAQGVAPHPALA